MRAFVIKNKEGRYYRESDVGLNFTTILSNANMYTDKIDAEMWVKENLILKGCKVQEITIAEGDLEEALESVCNGYVEPNVYGTDIWEEAEKCGGLKQYFIQQAEENKDE